MKINKINKILLSLAIFTFILSVKVGVVEAQSPICPVGQIPDPDNGACVIPSIKYEIFNYLAEGNTVLSEIAYDGNEALPDGSYTPNVNSVGPTYGIKIDIESPINGLNIEYRLASIYGLGSLSPWFSNGNFAYMPIESGPPFYRDGVQLSGIEIRLVNPPPGIKEIRYKANCYTFYFDGSWHYEQAQTPWTNVGFAFCPDVDPKMQVQGISIELVTEPVYETPPPVTTFDYSLSDGGDRYISPGGSVTNPITATLVTAPTEPVDLSISSIKNSSNVDVLNQTNGINATVSDFSPNPVTPTQISQLTLKATAGVPAGVYTVAVSGNTENGSECPAGEIYVIRGPSSDPNWISGCERPVFTTSYITDSNTYNLKSSMTNLVTTIHMTPSGSYPPDYSTPNIGHSSLKYRIRSVDGTISSWFGFAEYADGTTDWTNVWANIPYSGSPYSNPTGNAPSDPTLFKSINAIEFQLTNIPEGIESIRYRAIDGTNLTPSEWISSGFASAPTGINSPISSFNIEPILSQNNNTPSKSTIFTVTIESYNLTLENGNETNGGGLADCTTSSIVLNWDKVTGIDHYKIYRFDGISTTTVSSSILQPVSGTTVTYADLNLPAGGYTYTVEGLLTNNTVVSGSQPQTWFAPPTDSSKCLLCDSFTSTSGSSPYTLSWTSSNATSCTIKDGAGTTISNPATNSSVQVTPASTETYTLSCNGPEPLPGDDGICTLSKTVTVSESAPGNLNLWLNNNELLTAIRVRPRQEFGLNWRGSDLPGLQSGTCSGSVNDSNGPVPVNEWVKDPLTDPLPDNQYEDSFKITTELDKGTYIFGISCLNDVGGVISPVSDTVEVTVTQAKIEER